MNETDLLNSFSEVFVYCQESGNLFWAVDRKPNIRAGDKAGGISRGYFRVKVFGRSYLVHRVVWAMSYGKWPMNFIDHIDGDKLNNRLSNLRDVPHQTNMMNKRNYKSNYSGIPGVARHKANSKWVVYLNCKGVRHYLGSFSVLSDAALVRKDAELKYFGKVSKATRNYLRENQK